VTYYYVRHRSKRVIAPDCITRESDADNCVQACNIATGLARLTLEKWLANETNYQSVEQYENAEWA